MKSLRGKVAVVTGGSKGIGASISKGLGASGAAVVVVYASDRDGAERVAGEIRARDGRAITVQADVAKAADVQRVFAETKKEFGRLDVLVNNAGVFRFAPLEQATEAEFHSQFATNVLGTILAARESLPYFGREGGSIVNVSSVVSTTAVPNSVIYAATKGAVDTVTRVLANELAPRKIRVNTVAPGAIDTEGARAAGVIGSEWEKQIIERTPLRRMGAPDDIADVVRFLASDDSRWLTGERIVASGGFR
jgi:3-oxoacyl-[acyl-carrier protein] reductase